MPQIDQYTELDDRIWQAWIQKNAAQDKVRFARRVKVIELVSGVERAVVEIHKVKAYVLQTAGWPGSPRPEPQAKLVRARVGVEMFTPPPLQCPPISFVFNSLSDSCILF